MGVRGVGRRGVIVYQMLQCVSVSLKDIRTYGQSVQYALQVAASYSCYRKQNAARTLPCGQAVLPVVSTLLMLTVTVLAGWEASATVMNIALLHRHISVELGTLPSKKAGFGCCKVQVLVVLDKPWKAVAPQAGRQPRKAQRKVAEAFNHTMW